MELDIEDITDSVFVADPKTRRLVSCNSEAEKLVGKPKKKILGMIADQLHPPDVRKRTMDDFRLQAADKKKVSESEVLASGGKRIPVSIKTTLTRLNGKTVLVGIFRDITEQKNAEEEIKYLKEYNENILESDPNPILVMKGSRIEYVNKSFISAFGKTKNHYISKKLNEIMPPDVVPNLKEVLSDYETTKELEIKNKHFSVSSFIVKKAEEEEEEEEVRVGIIMQDVSKRKKAEEELIKSKDRYKTIFSSSRDALMTLVSGGRFTSGNPATLEMFGCRGEKEFASKTPADVSPKLQPDGESSESKAKRMMDTAMKKGSHFFEWTHKKINGKEFPATVLLTRTELEGVPCLLATVRDVTEQKKSEELLRGYGAKLEQDVKRRTEDLIKQNTEVVRKSIDLAEAKKALEDRTRTLDTRMLELEEKNRQLEEFKEFALLRENERMQLREEVERLRKLKE